MGFRGTERHFNRVLRNLISNGSSSTMTYFRCTHFAAAAAAVSAVGELVLWGATLWDPRVPAPLHTFDQLSSNAGGAGGVFHPNGGEIILNSEVSPGGRGAAVKGRQQRLKP